MLARAEIEQHLALCRLHQVAGELMRAVRASARMAQLAAQGKLRPGDRFVHESYIGSRFIGRVEEQVQLAGQPAIVPSIEGSARVTGMNTLWIDDVDPFWRGFQVI